jgi:hypothetical protein
MNHGWTRNTDAERAPGSPKGTNENSPRIHPWVADRVGNESLQGRKKFGVLHAVFRPSGAWGIFETAYPPLKRWAIFGSLAGTKTSGGDDRSAGFSPLQRSTTEERGVNFNALEMRTMKRRERRAPARNGSVQK